MQKTGNGQTAQIPCHTSIPQDDLEVFECVGAGGYGSVFRGIWKTNNGEITVAVKRGQVLEKEADVMSRIQHRNVIEFYGVSKHDWGMKPEPCIVTEFAEGGSLYDHLHNPDITAIDNEQIITWALQIAHGVDYLHHWAPVTVIHGDLKSHNVVFGAGHVCKLCDFGLSKDTIHSSTNVPFGGTLAWMSPEIIRQETKISTATDVWSYGVILWEMVARKVPYEHEIPFYIMNAIAQEGGKLMIPEDCPAAFASLMRNCWKMDAKERCNMHQVIDALDRVKVKQNEMRSLHSDILSLNQPGVLLTSVLHSVSSRSSLSERKSSPQRSNYRRPELREYTTDDELNEALSLTGNDPYMLPVYNAIKGRQRALANGGTDFIRVFGYPWNNPDVWICVIGNGLFSWIYIWTNPTKTIADDTLEAAVGQFSGCFRIQFRHSLYSPRHIASKVREICSRLTKRKWVCGRYQYYFFMNEQQQKIVREMNVEMPSGYRFDDVDPDRDEYKCFPCVAVRRGDQLMRIGYLRFGYWGIYRYENENYSYIPKEDESSVLSALETRVYQECFSQRFCPLQSVIVNDKDELDKYNKSKLWTRLQDGDGNPIVVDYIK